MKRVLLTRPFEDSEQSAARLLQHGFEPVLKPLSRLKIMPFMVKEPTDALIFTSFRAIAALENLHNLTHLPSFVVGERTKEILSNLGFRTIIIAKDGLSLSEIIKNSHYTNFLWASGAVAAVDIVALCPNKSITRNIVYEMEMRPQTIDCAALKIDYVLHYSLETTQYFIKIAKNLEKSHHICLSQRVARPLLATVLCSIAQQPNEKSLFACLMRENTAI